MATTITHPTAYQTKVAVPLPSEDELRQIIGSSFERTKSLNVEKMAAGTHDMYGAFMGMVTAIFNTSDIDAKSRELIILRSAKILDCPYEWQANETMARNAGCTQAEIDAVSADDEVSGIDEHYVLLCKATDELSRGATLTDETLLQMQARFDDVLCRKYVMTIAWFNLLTRFLNGTRVPLETSDKIGSRTSPVG